MKHQTFVGTKNIDKTPYITFRIRYQPEGISVISFVFVVSCFRIYTCGCSVDRQLFVIRAPACAWYHSYDSSLCSRYRRQKRSIIHHHCRTERATTTKATQERRAYSRSFEGQFNRHIYLLCALNPPRRCILCLTLFRGIAHEGSETRTTRRPP